MVKCGRIVGRMSAIEKKAEVVFTFLYIALDQDGTPVTKVLLCHASLTYLLFAVFLQNSHQHLFHYDQDVFAKRQWRKMFMSKIVFLELPDLLFSSLLIYNFRIFERRFGSRKFISHIISTAIVANVLELIVFSALNRLGIQLGPMPTGMYSFVFPFYISFYCSIPRVALMRIAGVPVTGKTLNYILGLQMASSDVERILVVACAVVSGLLWKINFLRMQTMLQVPMGVGRMFDWGIGRFLESTDIPSPSLPMGATLELQQRERFDRLEQQMMAQALQASRRMDIGRPQPMNPVNGPGIFGNVHSHRGANHEQGENELGGSDSEAISDEQVNRLVEMGFSDAQVRQALRAANNNPTQATNFLLQGL